MDRAVALTAIVPFLACFRQCFTQPGFFYFQQFVLACWLETERRTVTQVWRFAATAKHFSNFHRFLKTYRWSPEALTTRLLAVLLARLDFPQDDQGRRWLLVALDDTLVRKFGRKMEGAGWQYDAMAPNPAAPLAFGQCWVTLGLLWHQHDRWWFLAGAAWLFRPPKVTPQAQQETKLALVARRLKAWRLPEQLRLRIVADAAYGKRTLAEAVWELGYHLISRLPSNAVVFEKAPPPPAGAKRRGKPRRYGAKQGMSAFAVLAAAAPAQTLRLYGQDWQVRLYADRVLSRSLGGVEILLVTVLREGKRGKLSKPTYLFSTDLTLTPEAVVEAYAARFAIELAFRELKQHFGLGHYQARRATAAERHVALCLLAYTGSQLLLLAGAGRAVAAPWRPAPPLVTTGQLRHQVRRDRRAEIILAICERHGISGGKHPALYADLLQAA